MTKAQVDFAFEHYKEYSARCAFLRGQIEQFKRILADLEAHIAEDEISITAQYSDMPHGSGISDPTGSVGLRLASGFTPKRVKDTRSGIERLQAEYDRKYPRVAAVEACLLGMSDRERYIVSRKTIENACWREIIDDFAAKFGDQYSKSSLRRMMIAAMEKAYKIAK